ncbi:polysaccharide biosynthesis C-terminal domain-containing protein [Halospeciosus flavus]
MARISNLETRGYEWHDDFRNALSMGSILAVPIFVGSLVMAEEIIVTAFSGQYAGAGAFLVGLALYRLLVTQTSARGAVLGGLDRPDIGFWISLAELLINVALGLGLWYVYGPIGIVAATVLTQAFSYTAQTLVVRRLANVETVVTRPFLEQLGAGVAMGVVIWLAKRLYGLGEWYTVVALIGLGGVVYFVVLLAVSSYLRETVRGILEDFAATYV